MMKIRPITNRIISTAGTITMITEKNENDNNNKKNEQNRTIITITIKFRQEIHF